MDAILSFQNVTKRFPSAQGRGLFTAVEDASFDMFPGEILGLLGESGCGKSTLARMLLKLIPVSEGRILYKNQDVTRMDERAFHPLRREIQMVFQNPFNCLDPRVTIRRLLMEPLKVWNIGDSAADRLKRIEALCDECGLPVASLDKRPGEFSGGQLQRIAIIRALLTEPKLLVADEIVSALDVSVQSQILQLLLDMRRRHGLTILFITHDLAVIERMADRVMVMRHGHIRQVGPCDAILRSPTDDYVTELKRAGFWML
ncbi:MAG: ABC transporter ATP-binding protein [Clostridia bacterium]|nr:ABC transporter ATP-binding protein [Clostridia bacterium]